MFGIFASCTNANANEYVQSSRYVEIDISPNMNQVDPLRVVVDFSFPQSIETVGEALYLLISPSGYRFSLKDNDIAYLLFELPLPQVHRHIGPVRFKEAISILSGKGFIAEFDESLRRISFTTESDSIKVVDVAPYKAQWLDRKSTNHFTIKSPAVDNLASNIEDGYLVQSGDSVSAIAEKLGIPYTKTFTDFLVKNNPHAFLNNNPNLLMSGVTIKVSSL